MRRSATTVALVALAGVALSGCQSTQEKSAALERQARKGAAEEDQGVRVTRANPDARVADAVIVADEFGAAAAVEVRSTGARTQASVPVSISVTGARGKRLFANDAPGLEPSLNHVPVLRAGERLWWVHDQVTAQEAEAVRARVGPPEARAPARVPRLTIASRLRLERNVQGTLTRGRVSNRSDVDQVDLRLFGIARRGRRVVAAGRGGLNRLAARRTRAFRLFWIGKPRGARIEVFAPPSTLR